MTLPDHGGIEKFNWEQNLLSDGGLFDNEKPGKKKDIATDIAFVLMCTLYFSVGL